MSRWVENFENHAFHENWSNIQKLIPELKMPSGSSATNIKELARFKKIFKYLTEVLSAIDPELVPSSIWDGIGTQSNKVFSQLSSYKSNSDAGHITNANNYVDHILTSISPYIQGGKGAAQAAGRAFKEYSKAIDEQIELLNEETTEVIQAINEDQTTVENQLQAVNEATDKISQLEQQLLVGDDEQPSLQQQIETLHANAAGWHETIEGFHQDLTVGGDEQTAIIDDINTAKENTTALHNHTRTAFDASQGIINELTQFYTRVFGIKDDKGNVVSGLELELKTRNKNLDDFKSKQEEICSALKEQIEGLIPGATNASLATAYKEKKEAFDDPIGKASRLFYGSLAGLIFVSMVFIFEFGYTSNDGFSLQLIDISDPTKLFSNLFFKLPITLPFIWLALTAQRSRNESRRLQEEYAHKEALAKSFQSFKQQIQHLGDKGDEALLKQLLEAAITTVAFNASSTMDAKKKDDKPDFDTVKDAAKEFLSMMPESKG